VNILKVSFLLFFAFLLHIYAQAPLTSQSSYIDETHETISKSVVDYSKKIDTIIYNWTTSDDYYDYNETTKKTSSVDKFFKNEKYIDKTEDSFVQIKLKSQINSHDKNKIDYDIKAHIPLSRSKKKFNLFIENSLDDGSNKNNLNEIENSKTEIGVNFFSNKFYNIKPKYSVGIRSFDPFVRARYSFEKEYNDWDVELSQIFKLSIKDEFSERTSFYFDKKIKENNLFRVYLHRETESEADGMDYTLGLSYYIHTKENTAIRVSQSFFGNTKYKYLTDNNTYKEYSGINSYTTSVSLRKNVWKKWIYYQISPSATFYNHNTKKENYSLDFFLEFYFGRQQNR